MTHQEVILAAKHVDPKNPPPTSPVECCECEPEIHACCTLQCDECFGGATGESCCFQIGQSGTMTFTQMAYRTEICCASGLFCCPRDRSRRGPQDSSDVPPNHHCDADDVVEQEPGCMIDEQAEWSRSWISTITACISDPFGSFTAIPTGGESPECGHVVTFSGGIGWTGMLANCGPAGGPDCNDYADARCFCLGPTPNTCCQDPGPAVGCGVGNIDLYMFCEGFDLYCYGNLPRCLGEDDECEPACEIFQLRSSLIFDFEEVECKFCVETSDGMSECLLTVAPPGDSTEYELFCEDVPPENEPPESQLDRPGTPHRRLPIEVEQNPLRRVSGLVVQEEAEE